MRCFVAEILLLINAFRLSFIISKHFNIQTQIANRKLQAIVWKNEVKDRKRREPTLPELLKSEESLYRINPESITSNQTIIQVYAKDSRKPEWLYVKDMLFNETTSQLCQQLEQIRISPKNKNLDIENAQSAVSRHLSELLLGKNPYKFPPIYSELLCALPKIRLIKQSRFQIGYRILNDTTIYPLVYVKPRVIKSNLLSNATQNQENQFRTVTSSGIMDYLQSLEINKKNLQSVSKKPSESLWSQLLEYYTRKEMSLCESNNDPADTIQQRKRIGILLDDINNFVQNMAIIYVSYPKTNQSIEMTCDGSAFFTQEKSWYCTAGVILNIDYSIWENYQLMQLQTSVAVSSSSSSSSSTGSVLQQLIAKKQQPKLKPTAVHSKDLSLQDYFKTSLLFTINPCTSPSSSSTESEEKVKEKGWLQRPLDAELLGAVLSWTIAQLISICQDHYEQDNISSPKSSSHQAIRMMKFTCSSDSKAVLKISRSVANQHPVQYSNSSYLFKEIFQSPESLFRSILTLPYISSSSLQQTTPLDILYQWHVGHPEKHKSTTLSSWTKADWQAFLADHIAKSTMEKYYPLSEDQEKNPLEKDLAEEDGNEQENIAIKAIKSSQSIIKNVKSIDVFDLFQLIEWIFSSSSSKTMIETKPS
jgi:hypothetical protein